MPSKREQILQVNSKDCPNCVVVVFVVVVLFLVVVLCFVFVCVYQGRIYISQEGRDGWVSILSNYHT